MGDWPASSRFPVDPVSRQEGPARHRREPRRVALALLGGLALVLELLAVALPGGGFFSAAPACYLAALSAPPVALWMAAAALLARGLRQGGGVRPWVVDFAPVLAAAGLLLLQPRLPFIYAFDVYLVVSWFAPGRTRLRLLWFAVAMLAPALASGPWMVLWLAPALLALQFAADRAVQSLRVEDRERLRAHLERSQQELADSRGLHRELQGRVDLAMWRGELERQLAQPRSVAETARLLVRLTLSLLRARSVIVFAVDDQGQQTPLAWQSPFAERLESAVLLRLREPCVDRAWRTQAESEATEESGRLCEGELPAVGLPMGPQAVLYVSGELGPAAWLVAQSGAAALERSRAFEGLQGEARRSQQLAVSLDRLTRLLDSGSQLTSNLSTEQVVDRLQASLSGLVEADFQGVVEGGEGPFAEVARVVSESQRPLLIARWSDTRLVPVAGVASLVAVPMGEQVVVAASRREGAYTREHQDVLQLLAYQAAQALGNARLHEQVVEAYRRLKESEAQLIQSSKLAAVGQLAAGVAHELNTPLGTVILGLEATAREHDPVLQMAWEAAQQAREIVAKLLYYARDARVARQSCDLNQVVRDTLQLIGQQLRLDGVKVELALAELPSVMVNQNELQQVFTNLLLNARDAGRHIRVESRALPQAVQVLVGDDGPPIPDEVRGRLFDPFFTTKPVGKGTGLGLSISLQIVTAHGGTLELGKAPETVFCVTIPREEPAP